MLGLIHSQDLPTSNIYREQFRYQPGDEVNGGYFAGMFRLNDEGYGLILSPKNVGEFNNVQWEAYRLTINCSNYTDGLANTEAMAEAGNQTAKKVLQLHINELNDWYIPSRDELEIIYRNFKPTADANLTLFRDGENPGSIPPGYPYTTVLPAQTQKTNFQFRGEQAMEAACYWSSTQSSMYAAWTQHFKHGQHHTDHKIAMHKVRVVRRFKL